MSPQTVKKSVSARDDVQNQQNGNVITNKNSKGSVVNLTPRSDLFINETIKSIEDRSLTYLQAGIPVHLSGPAGTGKSTLAFQIAARLNRPSIIMTGDAWMKASDLVGSEGVNAAKANLAIDLALRSVAVYADIMQMRMEALSPHLSLVRPHAGQTFVQQKLDELLETSNRVDRNHIASRGVDIGLNEGGEQAWPQDPYSLRCLPQIFGAIHDVIGFHDQMVEVELNSVTDNPIVVDEEPYVIHGGNFYGQHVGFASDSLVLGLLKAAILLERQIARITDETFNKGLPPFLQPNSSGINSGFMGAQVTASALLAEMRTKAIPASVQSIPTNGNNQDVNTMGTIAARKASSVLEDLYNILAIHALCVAQAFELTLDTANRERHAETSAAFVASVRAVSESLIKDRPLSKDIQDLAHVMSAGLFDTSEK